MSQIDFTRENVRVELNTIYDRQHMWYLLKITNQMISILYYNYFWRIFKSSSNPYSQSWGSIHEENIIYNSTVWNKFELREHDIYTISVI